MLRVRGKRGEFLICQDRECGTRIVEEDKSSKNTRERYNGASKADINKYLNKNDKEPVNNAFAEQLKGLKF